MSALDSICPFTHQVTSAELCQTFMKELEYKSQNLGIMKIVLTLYIHCKGLQDPPESSIPLWEPLQLDLAPGFQVVSTQMPPVFTLKKAIRQTAILSGKYTRNWHQVIKSEASFFYSYVHSWKVVSPLSLDKVRQVPDLFSSLLDNRKSYCHAKLKTKSQLVAGKPRPLKEPISNSITGDSPCLFQMGTAVDSLPCLLFFSS